MEGPPDPNAVNIRPNLYEKLFSDYGVGFCTIQKYFAFVTDGAMVMAKVAGTSKSRSAEENKRTWMRFYVHVSNNLITNTIGLCEKSTILSSVYQDFNYVKRIIGSSNRSGWNFLLGQGYRLKQAEDTRFDSGFLVVERSLHSASKVWPLLG